MVQYPIQVALKSYKGSQPNLIRKNTEDNRIAAELEKVVNEMIKSSNENIVEVLYDKISFKTGHSTDKIRELLYAVDSGNNGLTAYKQPPQRTKNGALI